MANDANAISSAGISLLAKNNKFFLPPRYSALDQADTFQIYEKSFRASPPKTGHRWQKPICFTYL